MKEQGRLFEVESSEWVERLWERIEDRERRKVLMILAGMALDSLQTPGTQKEGKKSRTQEATDES